MKFPSRAYRAEGDAAVNDPPQGGAPAVAAPPSVSTPPQWLTDLKLEGDYAPLVQDKTLHNYKTLPDALRAIPEQRKTIAAGSQIPGPDAKPEQIRAFWDKLGVPKDVDGYKDVKAPEIEGMKLSETGMKQYIENVALKTGQTVAQVQANINFLGEWQKQQQQAMVGAWIDGQEELRQAWGANFDRNVTIAKRGLAHALKASGAGDELIDLLATSGIHEHPGFIKLAAWMGRNLMEEGLVAGSPDGGHTQAQLDQQIAETAKKLGSIGKNDPQYASTMAAHEAALKARYGTEEVGTTVPR